jgi:ADP-ribosyl-[dinitrogen reductase] hydrolase
LEGSTKPRASLRAGGFVIHTLEAAFWSLRNAENAEAAIVAAVALGEDADTTGAVAGALAGAWQGASALPERWLARLQPRAELTAHADRLLAAAGEP